MIEAVIEMIEYCDLMDFMIFVLMAEVAYIWFFV